MKFKELVDEVSWEEVKQSLEKFYEYGEEDLMNYEIAFCKLCQLEPEEYNMRICVNWVDPTITLEDNGYWCVDGFNGTLQKETEDWPYFADRCTEEFANSEVGYALDFTSWNKWLGMDIDPKTANNIKLMKSDIVALCLWEMIFHSYDEEEIQETLEEIKDRVESIKNMSEEELKANTVSLEELKKRLKKFGEDIENSGKEE
jgi:hypothetical protein